MFSGSSLENEVENGREFSSSDDQDIYVGSGPVLEDDSVDMNGSAHELEESSSGFVFPGVSGWEEGK